MHVTEVWESLETSRYKKDWIEFNPEARAELILKTEGKKSSFYMNLITILSQQSMWEGAQHN